jgi:hypothetical protein
MGKNPIRVRVRGILPPTGMLVGENLTHRVKRVRVRFSLPHTRYTVGQPFVYDRLAIRPFSI